MFEARVGSRKCAPARSVFNAFCSNPNKISGYYNPQLEVALLTFSQ